MHLEQYLQSRLKEKNLLIMSHLVLGYPDFQTSMDVVKNMVQGGVDLIELQIPFSEPIADGPVILRASQRALDNGIRVQACLELAGTLTEQFPIPFLIMTYYNVPYRYGLERFVSTLRSRGVAGTIIPDLPPEEGQDFLKSMKREGLAPIFIFSPTSSVARMAYLSSMAEGFIYCVARKGVTGARTAFSGSLEEYLARCRRATDLPLAVGFGVREKKDVAYLKGKADIAVIGTHLIRLLENQGSQAVRAFVQGLHEEERAKNTVEPL